MLYLKYGKLNFSIFKSNSLSILSLKGVDVLNGLFISLKNYKKDSLDADSFDFLSLVKSYAKFLLSSVYLENAKSFELSFKKFKFLLSQVKIL